MGAILNYRSCNTGPAEVPLRKTCAGAVWQNRQPVRPHWVLLLAVLGLPPDLTAVAASAAEGPGRPRMRDLPRVRRSPLQRQVRSSQGSIATAQHLTSRPGQVPTRKMIRKKNRARKLSPSS